MNKATEMKWKELIYYARQPVSVFHSNYKRRKRHL